MVRVNVLYSRTLGVAVPMSYLCWHLVKAVRLEGASAQGRDVDGRVLVHDLGPDLRKGTVLGGRHLERVRQAAEVHLVELEPGDVH